MTLILEPNNTSDFQLFVELAKRLNVNFRLMDEDAKQKEAHFFSLAGTLEIPETGNELLAIIEKGKSSKDIDFSI